MPKENSPSTKTDFILISQIYFNHLSSRSQSIDMFQESLRINLNERYWDLTNVFVVMPVMFMHMKNIMGKDPIGPVSIVIRCTIYISLVINSREIVVFHYLYKWSIYKWSNKEWRNIPKSISPCIILWDCNCFFFHMVKPIKVLSWLFLFLFFFYFRGLSASKFINVGRLSQWFSLQSVTYPWIWGSPIHHIKYFLLIKIYRISSSIEEAFSKSKVSVKQWCKHFRQLRSLHG